MTENTISRSKNRSLLLSDRASRMQRLGSFFLSNFLLLVTSISMITVFFIIFFIAKDAFPFFKLEGFKEFFTSTRWYPSAEHAEFGAFSIFYGTFMVTLGAVLFSVPLGITAAVCLSDLLPFKTRQYVKPVIEILAAIPSVAYGFFALVILAPMLQNNGGRMLSYAAWVIGIPIFFLGGMVLVDIIIDRFADERKRKNMQIVLNIFFSIIAVVILSVISKCLWNIEISSGTNAFNASIILGIMALPTIVSMSEDALQAVGRDLRQGSYALGATRAETIVKVILPAASSGILAAIILGTMRAIGETMVVWMASGNSAHIPDPWFNFFEPIRTLTATIAGDMGEADHVTGSARYHVLFAMAFLFIGIFFCFKFI